MNDKFRTKQVLADAGVPVPPTIALLHDRDQLQRFKIDDLPDAWAVKPNHGRRGEGILLAQERSGDDWLLANGHHVDENGVRTHISRILDGESSLDGAHQDSAIIEPLIRPHRSLARLVPYGLPDIRIICFRTVPLMAMVRLPTRASAGRANLHQGAIGAAVDFPTGRITRAVLGQTLVTSHGCTGAELIGTKIPLWREAVIAAAKCARPLGLGYVGVDIVLDDQEGVLVLECNAYPGIEVQNINKHGLLGRIETAQRFLAQRRARARRLRDTRALANSH